MSFLLTRTQMRLTICLKKRYLSIVRTILNSVYAFLNTNCPSISHDQPSSPYFFLIHELASKSLSNGFNRFVGKSEKPPDVVTTISTRDKLITNPKKVYDGFYTNKPNKLVKS
jgi:hypothetical protein